MKTLTAKNIDQQIQQLAHEALMQPSKSQARQQKLNEMARLIMRSGKLWQENTPYFEDALQQTWLYFCRNINSYDQNKCNVTTWLNNCLKWRLRDLYSAQTKERAKLTSLSEEISEEVTSPGQHLANLRNISLIIEEIYQWVETDPEQDLQNVHIKGHPNVTCQILILRRLPPEISWKNIAQEFTLPFSTAPNFYRRECLPRLKKFAFAQGYRSIIV
jgi:DNA-directed RNA polymerase specialized sigma24 family protein